MSIAGRGAVWSTRDQEAKSLDERKESPSRVTVGLRGCAVRQGGKQRAQTDHRLGRGEREEGASILTTLPHGALPWVGHLQYGVSF